MHHLNSFVKKTRGGQVRKVSSLRAAPPPDRRPSDHPPPASGREGALPAR
jgi:hypothetical protein